MCICDDSSCCRRYFPEWTKETSMTLFWIKLILVLMIAGVICAFPVLDSKVFDEASITWTTMGFILAYGIVLAYLLVLYWPYQHRIAPMWLQSIIYLIWAVFTVVVFANGWHFHWWQRSDIQNDALDVWTIVMFTFIFCFIYFSFPFFLFPFCNSNECKQTKTFHFLFFSSFARVHALWIECGCFLNRPVCSLFFFLIPCFKSKEKR